MKINSLQATCVVLEQLMCGTCLCRIHHTNRLADTKEETVMRSIATSRVSTLYKLAGFLADLQAGNSIRRKHKSYEGLEAYPSLFGIVRKSGKSVSMSGAGRIADAVCLETSKTLNDIKNVEGRTAQSKTAQSIRNHETCFSSMSGIFSHKS